MEYLVCGVTGKYIMLMIEAYNQTFRYKSYHTIRNRDIEYELCWDFSKLHSNGTPTFSCCVRHIINMKGEILSGNKKSY